MKTSARHPSFATVLLFTSAMVAAGCVVDAGSTDDEPALDSAEAAFHAPPGAPLSSSEVLPQAAGYWSFNTLVDGFIPDASGHVAHGMVLRRLPERQTG